MKHAAFFEGLRYCLILHSAFFILHCHAALPRSWQVNAGVGRVVDLPAAFHGEEVELRADFVDPAGQPFALPEGDWKLYFQTNGMDSLYFGPFPASAASNSVSAVFSPTNDPGAAQITGYLSLPGSIYHAAFRLRFLPSPGATPNALALPTPTLNFATTTILNPPWPAEIEALSNTLSQAIAEHATNATIHITDGERTVWDSKADIIAYDFDNVYFVIQRDMYADEATSCRITSVLDSVAKTEGVIRINGASTEIYAAGGTFLIDTSKNDEGVWLECIDSSLRWRLTVTDSTMTTLDAVLTMDDTTRIHSGRYYFVVATRGGLGHGYAARLARRVVEVIND